VVWGAVHGLGLAANHLWREVAGSLGVAGRVPQPLGRLLGLVLTFLLVTLAWVVFRADSLQTAQNILAAMLGLHGLVLPASWSSALGFLHGSAVFSGKDGLVFAQFGDARGFKWLFLLLLWVWLLPSSWSLFARLDEKSGSPVLLAAGSQRPWQWQPNAVCGVLLGGVLVVSVLHMSRVSEFLYFQF
jgi:hypothetical protein